MGLDKNDSKVRRKCMNAGWLARRRLWPFEGRFSVCLQLCQALPRAVSAQARKGNETPSLNRPILVVLVRLKILVCHHHCSDFLVAWREVIRQAHWVTLSASFSQRSPRLRRQGSGLPEESCKAANCPAENSAKSFLENVCFNLRILIAWKLFDSMIYNPAGILAIFPSIWATAIFLLYTYHFPLFIFSDWCSGSGCFLLWDS